MLLAAIGSGVRSPIHRRQAQRIRHSVGLLGASERSLITSGSGRIKAGNSGNLCSLFLSAGATRASEEFSLWCGIVRSLRVSSAVLLFLAVTHALLTFRWHPYSK